MTLTLYAADFASVSVIRCSPPSWMAQIALSEKGAAHRVEWLDFAKGEHRTPEMLARNARGTIPVLSDGAIHIHETFAILEYIDFAQPNPPLMPADPADRARALTRFHESGELKAKGMMLFAYLMRTADTKRDDDHLAELGRGFESEVDRWEQHVTDEGWLAAAFCLADIAVYAYLATALQLGLSLSERPRLAAYCARMRQRPSVALCWPATWGALEPTPMW